MDLSEFKVEGEIETASFFHEYCKVLGTYDKNVAGRHFVVGTLLWTWLSGEKKVLGSWSACPDCIFMRLLCINFGNLTFQGPPSIFYIPDFITEEDEKVLLDKIYKAPIPKWTALTNRRLQNWGGLPHPRGMIAEKLPAWLKKYVDDIVELNLFNGKIPNHVLVNEYTPGQGIMPHLDGSLFHPTITTVNLGSTSVINFYTPLSNVTKEVPDYKQRLKFSLFLQPRSLLVLQDECYNNYLHGIEEITSDTISESVINAKAANVSVGEEITRGTRVSMTIRFVPRTTKAPIRIGRN